MNRWMALFVLRRVGMHGLCAGTKMMSKHLLLLSKLNTTLRTKVNRIFLATFCHFFCNILETSRKISLMDQIFLQSMGPPQVSLCIVKMMRLLSKEGEASEMRERKEVSRARKTYQHGKKLLLHYLREHPFSTRTDGWHHLYDTLSISVLSQTVSNRC